MLPIMMYILLFCLLKDGDIDFILAPAVGSLTTAATGTGQGPSTSTIPGENLSCFILLGFWKIDVYTLHIVLYRSAVCLKETFLGLETSVEFSSLYQ